MKRKPKSRNILSFPLGDNKIAIGSLIVYTPTDKYYVIAGYEWTANTEWHVALDQCTGVMGLHSFGKLYRIVEGTNETD